MNAYLDSRTAESATVYDHCRTVSIRSEIKNEGLLAFDRTATKLKPLPGPRRQP